MTKSSRANPPAQGGKASVSGIRPACTLVSLNRNVLKAFSRRTTEALRAVLPKLPAMSVALPRIEPFLALNVDKEVQKDALVIRRVGEALAAGLSPGLETRRELLEAS